MKPKINKFTILFLIITTMIIMGCSTTDWEQLDEIGFETCDIPECEGAYATGEYDDEGCEIYECPEANTNPGTGNEPNEGDPGQEEKANLKITETKMWLLRGNTWQTAAILKNEGEQAATLPVNEKIGMYLSRNNQGNANEELIGYDVEPTQTTINPGEKIQVTITTTPNADLPNLNNIKTGNKIILKADYNNIIDEENEADNTYEYEIKPNLVLNDVEYEFDKELNSNKGIYNIKFIIANTGDKPIETTNIDVLKVYSCIGNICPTEIGTIHEDELKILIDETKEYYVRSTEPIPSLSEIDNTKIKIVLDPNNIIDEENEADNTRILQAQTEQDPESELNLRLEDTNTPESKYLFVTLNSANRGSLTLNLGVNEEEIYIEEAEDLKNKDFIFNLNEGNAQYGNHIWYDLNPLPTGDILRFKLTARPGFTGTTEIDYHIIEITDMNAQPTTQNEHITMNVPLSNTNDNIRNDPEPGTEEAPISFQIENTDDGKATVTIINEAEHDIFAWDIWPEFDKTQILIDNVEPPTKDDFVNAGFTEDDWNGGGMYVWNDEIDNYYYGKTAIASAYAYPQGPVIKYIFESQGTTGEILITFKLIMANADSYAPETITINIP